MASAKPCKQCRTVWDRARRTFCPTCGKRPDEPVTPYRDTDPPRW